VDFGPWTLDPDMLGFSDYAPDREANTSSYYPPHAYLSRGPDLCRLSQAVRDHNLPRNCKLAANHESATRNKIYCVTNGRTLLIARLKATMQDNLMKRSPLPARFCRETPLR